jgi:Peptidase M50B-like
VTRAQLILIGSTVLGSWLGMQAIHEAGHVLGARLTGGGVERVVLHPLTISRTDLAENPQPLLVAWAGPVFGAIAPILLWATASLQRMPGAFVLRFFSGFCLLANGLYIGVGSFDGIGDCGDLLRHGAPIWHLWLFGALTAPTGLWLWHRQGPHFGLGKAHGEVKAGVAYAALVACLGLLILGFAVGGE